MNKTSIPYIVNQDGTQGYSVNYSYGCQKCSLGCDNCWALELTKRFPVMNMSLKYGIDLLNDNKTDWRGTRYIKTCIRKFKPYTTIAVNFVSDILYMDDKVFKQCIVDIEQNPDTTFICCTKRPQNINLAADYNFPNIWLGLTICTQEEANEKIPILLKIKERNPKLKTWLSIEPMLTKIDLERSHLGFGFVYELNRPNWIICGGESGSKARACEKEWIKEIRDFCTETQTPFYFKQWSQKDMGKDYKIAEIDCKTYKDLPYLRKES